MLLWKLGKMIRGKATPLQVFLAGLLGGMLGFLPPGLASMGMLLVFFFLLAIINANLILAGLVAAGGALLRLLLLPLVFRVGGWVLDGPLAPVLERLINGAGTAWLGFERYTVTGGLVLGGLYGLLVGLGMAKGLIGVRRRLAAAAADPGKYAAWAAKPAGKWTLLLLFGGTKTTQPWEELLARNVGNPIRVLGVVMVVVILVAGMAVVRFMDETILTAQVRSALTEAHGATVDLESLQADWQAGRVEVNGLAFADPDDLALNLFSAEVVTIDVSGADLWRRRWALDKVEVSGARTGEARRVPGRLTAPRDKTERKFELPGYSLEEWLAQAKVWRERLERAQELWERFGADRSLPEPGEAEVGPTLRERLEAQAALLGYDSVVADHRRRSAPLVRIGELVIGRIEPAGFPYEAYRVESSQLSTHPWLLAARPVLTVRAESGTFGMDWQGAGAAGGPDQFSATWKDIPLDQVAAAWSAPVAFPFQGGTVTVMGEGSLGRAGLDLPVRLLLRNTTVAVGGQRQAVATLDLGASVRGPIGSPRIALEADSLRRLTEDVLRGRVQQEAERLLDRAVPGATSPGGLLDRLRPGSKP